MDLVALVKKPDDVCCRYRLEAFRPTLEQAGHSLSLVALPKNWWGRLPLYHRLRGANVILQRYLLPAWELSLLRARVARLLFDFDDAVFLRDSYSPRGQHHPRRLNRFAATLTRCDGVVAGNQFLAEQARRFIASERVRVIPTCVDLRRYQGSTPAPAGDGKELVWIGSSSTLQGIEKIAPLLESLGRAIPGLRLRVICDRFPEFANLEVVRRPWSAEREAQDLAEGNIGISWIPDDLWSRGKCGLKVLQYMAAGLPVVANDVGVHPEMIRHGETGYLANTPEQWHAAVLALTQDAALRRRMGAAGRRRLEGEFHVPAGGRAWRELLGGLT